MIAWLYWLFNSLICSTLKYKVINEPKAPVLFAAWHGESFPLFYWARHRNLCLYPTSHWRGNAIAYLAKKYGYKVIRFTEEGTPLERSQDLAKIMQATEEGYEVAIAVDGPPKPMLRHKAKPGILFISQKTGKPIVPTRIISKRKICLLRWDRYEIPLPWSTVEIRFGKPFKTAIVTELEESLAQLGAGS